MDSSTIIRGSFDKNSTKKNRDDSRSTREQFENISKIRKHIHNSSTVRENFDKNWTIREQLKIISTTIDTIGHNSTSTGEQMDENSIKNR